jgi:nicotinamidase-related amidase
MSFSALSKNNKERLTMFSTTNTVLIIIDVQEKLFRVMHEGEKLLENLQKLVKGMGILGIPMIVTEQNPAGLGTTLPELTNLLTNVKPIPKMSFSCLGEKQFSDELIRIKSKNVILTGIESHVCVYQTAVDLLQNAYTVYVAANCVSSRAKSNIDISLQEMSRNGVRLTTVEMVLFELLKTAENSKFKEISRIVK